MQLKIVEGDLEEDIHLNVYNILIFYTFLIILNLYVNFN